MMKYFKIFTIILVAFLYLTPTYCYADTESSTEEDANCTQERLDTMYKIKPNGEIEEGGCWYCNIVVIMTATYLNTAEAAIPVAQQLGGIILVWGYVIWLSIYILEKVSSLSAVKSGAMINDILTMSFKVAACTAIIKGDVATFLGKYLLQPVMSFGVDVGSALLEQLLT